MTRVVARASTNHSQAGTRQAALGGRLMIWVLFLLITKISSMFVELEAVDMSLQWIQSSLSYLPTRDGR